MGLELSRGGRFDWLVAYEHTRDRHEPGVYHVYNRASNGRKLFRDDEDRELFVDIVNRHLTKSVQFDQRGRPYANFHTDLAMQARNLLTTHYHLVLDQVTPGSICALMRRVIAPYTRHYNVKYGTKGSLFDHEYCSRRIKDRKSHMWRIAYVNDNHSTLGLEHPFSTHSLMLDPDPPSWIDARSALATFGGRDNYLAYLNDREIRNRLDLALRG